MGLHRAKDTAVFPTPCATLQWRTAAMRISATPLRRVAFRLFTLRWWDFGVFGHGFITGSHYPAEITLSRWRSSFTTCSGRGCWPVATPACPREWPSRCRDFRPSPGSSFLGHLWGSRLSPDTTVSVSVATGVSASHAAASKTVSDPMRHPALLPRK